MHTVTKRSIASLGITMIGVFVMITSLPVLTDLPTLLLGSSYDCRGDSLSGVMTILIILGGSITSLVLFLMLGCLVIRKANMIAEWFLPEDEIIGTMNGLSVENIAKIIIVGLGLFLFLRSLPGAITPYTAWLLGNGFTGFAWLVFGGPLRIIEPLLSLFLIVRPGTVYRKLVAPHLNKQIELKDIDRTEGGL